MMVKLPRSLSLLLRLNNNHGGGAGDTVKRKTLGWCDALLLAIQEAFNIWQTSARAGSDGEHSAGSHSAGFDIAVSSVYKEIQHTGIDM